MSSDGFIDWSGLLEQSNTEKLKNLMDELDSPKAQGTAFHEYLEKEYSDLREDLTFEHDVYTSDGEYMGRCDAFTEDFVYEFKTKSDLESWSLPLESDIEQVERYRNGLDVEFSAVVYLDRECIGEVETYINNI